MEGRGDLRDNFKPDEYGQDENGDPRNKQIHGVKRPLGVYRLMDRGFLEFSHSQWLHPESGECLW